MLSNDKLLKLGSAFLARLIVVILIIRFFVWVVLLVLIGAFVALCILIGTIILAWIG